MYVLHYVSCTRCLCTDIALHTGEGVQVKSVIDSASLNVQYKTKFIKKILFLLNIFLPREVHTLMTNASSPTSPQFKTTTGTSIHNEPTTNET